MCDSELCRMEKANEYVPQRSQMEATEGGFRSRNRQWDYIVCKVCVGCGKPLGRYENTKGLAFCRRCCEILFPESATEVESNRNRYPYPTRNCW